MAILPGRACASENVLSSYLRTVSDSPNNGSRIYTVYIYNGCRTSDVGCRLNRTGQQWFSLKLTGRTVLLASGRKWQQHFFPLVRRFLQGHLETSHAGRFLGITAHTPRILLHCTSLIPCALRVQTTSPAERASSALLPSGSQLVSTQRLFQMPISAQCMLIPFLEIVMPKQL